MTTEKKTPSVPVADMLDCCQTYSITINPNDSRQYFKKKKRIYLMHEYFVNYHFLRWKKNGISFAFNYEISNPWKSFNKKGVNRPARIHYHGIIKFPNATAMGAWYFKYYNRIIEHAMIEIDTIDNPKHWLSYCRKNEPLMKQICDSVGFPHYCFNDELLKWTKVNDKNTDNEDDEDYY